jgi:hypothetical protein
VNGRDAGTGTANVRIVRDDGGGAEELKEVRSGSSEIAVACISVSRRPHAATCMEAHWPACRIGMVDPVSLSCRKVTYPTAMADIYSSPAISCFAWCSGVVCGRSDAPNRGY